MKYSIGILPAALEQIRALLACGPSNFWTAWRHLQVTVVLSGPDTPGEGEHKIMDYIRASKAPSAGEPKP